MRNLDSLRSIIDDHGRHWTDKRVSITLIGEITILCHVEGTGEHDVATERSAVIVERAADQADGVEFNPSTVSLPAKAVSQFLKMLFDNYRNINVETATEEDHEEAAEAEDEEE